MADDRLRERERRARLGGIEDRQAWVAELRRTRAPQAREADAFQERLKQGLQALRQTLDERYNAYEGEAPARPCPELAVEQVLAALETALRPREGLGEVGYGSETLAAYAPREEEVYQSWCHSGVVAFAARLGDSVTLAVKDSSASKPTPGSAWGGGLSGWRDSLKPTTKETKLRAWAAAGNEVGVWETLTLEQAQLTVDLFTLPRTGALTAPAPIAKKGKVTWRGVIRGIQPRLKLNRPDGEDEYFGAGYALRLEGSVDDVERAFSVGVGVGALTKHAFRVGDTVSGVAKPVDDPAVVPVDFYRASKLAVASRALQAKPKTPPWHGPGPDLDHYRGGPLRELADAALDRDPCRACHWGCRVQVDAVPGHDRPLLPACFGPTSCPAFVPPNTTTPVGEGLAPSPASQATSTPVGEGLAPSRASKSTSTPVGEGLAPSRASKSTSTPVGEGLAPSRASKKKKTAKKKTAKKKKATKKKR